MPERYKNVKFDLLSEYITPDKFRTVSDDMRHIPMGITEFAVEVHMKNKLKSKLSFKAPWDGIIYGCARSSKHIKDKLELKSNIKTAYLMDWDDKYLFLLELENGREIAAAYVASEDILNLLENCMRVPEKA